MNGRIFAAATVAVVSYAISSLPVLGDNMGYYTPPKLVKQGTSSIPVVNGTVLLQVLVNPDATFKVQKIIQSTNPSNNQAAMEIANSAQYAPAVKGGKKVAAFYTYRLKFVVSAKANSAPVNQSPLAKYDADVHAGHYVDARSGLQSYLQSHPDDPQANALLGVSEFFLNNFADSATAFSKAGTVPSQFTTVAANAFAKAAQAAISSKNGPSAVAYATKAKALTPGAATWNLLGNAQLVNNDYPGAIQSFEQARALSPNDPKLDPKMRGTIMANLIAAYADSDQIDKAVALLPEMKQLDPDNSVGISHVTDYYAKKALAAQSAGKTSDAIAAYEKGASYGGPLAHTMYTNEALLLMRQVRPDWVAVKTVADKALALNGDDARANLAAGVALYNQRNNNGAVPYLEKAASSARASGDTDAYNMAQHWITEITGAGSAAAKPAPTPKPT